MCPKHLSIRVPWRSDGVDVEELDWPRPFDYIACGAPALIGLGILLQRDALFPPTIDTALVALAIAPWALQLMGRRPPRYLLSATILLAAYLLYSGVTGTQPVEDLTPFLLVLLAMEIAALAPLSESVVILALSLGVIALGEVSPGHASSEGVTHALPWYIGITAGWAGGFLLQSQLRVMTELKAAQADLAQRAAASERQRIAHELHDVIAHSLTVTMLHVTGARKALERNVSEASEALEQAERLGRQSLADVRRVVGILGASGESNRAPMPDAGDVRKLVEELNGAGGQVSLRTTGDVSMIAPTTGLALYRVVQESLTNAAKHAPGAPAKLHLNVDNGRVSLEVMNPLPEEPIPTESTGDGLGLWGMKERLSAVGGELEAGPEGNLWVVRATAPTRARA